MCGVVQFTVDILIVAQIYFYSKNEYSSLQGGQKE
jgi:hypothetical protein